MAALSVDMEGATSGGIPDFASPPKGSSYGGRRQSVAAESFDPEKLDDDDESEKVVNPKTDEQRQRLAHTVDGILLFRCLDEEQHVAVIDAMFEHKVTPGDKIITQGEDGDNFYVIESGTYDCYVNIKGEEKKVHIYPDKGSFGELALMYNCPRAATVIAVTEGTLWAMDRLTFQRIVLKAAFRKRQMYDSLLQNVTFLKELSDYERTNVADALVTRTFEDGAVVIRQGDPGSEMYFIEEGEVRIMREAADHEAEHMSGGEVEINRLKRGDYFGDLALLLHQNRAASVYAVGKVKVATLDVAAFERLLGPCLDVMKRNIDTYQLQLNKIFGDEINLQELRGGPSRKA